MWVHEQDVQMARTGKVGPRDGKTGAYLLRSAFWRTALVLGMRGATKIIPIQEVSGFGDGEVLDVPGSPRVVQASRRRSGRPVSPGRHDVVLERCWPAGAVPYLGILSGRKRRPRFPWTRRSRRACPAAGRPKPTTDVGAARWLASVPRADNCLHGIV